MTPWLVNTSMDGGGPRAVALLVTLLLLPPVAALGVLPPTPYGAWKTEAVHEPCWRNYDNDIAIGPDGTVHVVHQGCIETIASGTMPRPIYSRQTMLGWEHYESPFVGDDVKLVLSEDGVAHVAFLEYVYNADTSVRVGTQFRYAVWNGAGFDAEVVSQGSGFVLSITLDSTGGPSILVISDGVRVLTRSAPGTWSATLLNGNPNGFAGDMAVGPDGRLRVIEWHGNWGSYTAGVTYYEQQGDGSWTSEPAALGCFGNPRLAIDNQNNPHVSCAFVGPQGSGLYYAKRVAGAWSLQLVATLNPNYSDIKLDANDQPRIAFSFATSPSEFNRPLGYAVQVNGSFVVDRMLTEAVTARHIALALDGDGFPAIVLEQARSRGFSLGCPGDVCISTGDETVLTRPAITPPPAG